MRKYRRSDSKKLFINMILPYAYVLLVPMMIWIVSNMYITDNNEKKVVSLVMGNIENSVSVVDSNLNQIENIVMSMSQNSAFNDFFAKKNLTYAEKMKLQGILASYHVEYGLMHELYIYSRASDTVIDQNSVYNDPESFYGIKCGFEGKLREKWTKMTREVEQVNGYLLETIVLNAESNAEVLPYMRTMPIEYPSQRHGIVGVLIDKPTLLKNFEGLSADGDAEIYVYNRKGEAVMTNGNKNSEEIYEKTNSNNYQRVEIDGKKLHKFTYISPKNQWQYNILITNNSILRDIIAVSNILSTINFITFVMGLILCVFLTYGRRKSYMNIMDMLGTKYEKFYFGRIKKNEFEFMKPYVENLLAESRSMKKSMEKITKSESHKVFHLLFSTSRTGEETARKLCTDGNITFSGEKFVVLVFVCESENNIDEINTRNIFFAKILDKYISENHYLYIADAKTTVIIINHDMDTAEFNLNLRQQIATMNIEIFSRYHTDIIMGAGETTDRLSRLCKSYKEALEVASYNRLTDSKNMLFYSELPREQVMYYYPIEFENRFIKAVSYARVDEALNIIDIIYENNFVNRTLTAARIEELFAEIMSSLNKIRQVYFADEEMIDYRVYDFTIKSFFEYLKNFVYSACENMKVFDENSYNERFKEMLEYVNENYADNELSLTSLAQNFGLSDISHISKSFKKYMNENFSAYLERIRIEKACEMLRGNMQVKEVSEKCGYLSDASFRRAFKKRMGLSPSDYAKDIQRMENM